MTKPISVRIERLFLDVYRRNEIISRKGSNQPLEKRWLGLGTRTTYKSALDAGLMKFESDYPPRCMGWLRLTEKGIALFRELEPELKRRWELRQRVYTGTTDEQLRKAQKVIESELESLGRASE